MSRKRPEISVEYSDGIHEDFKDVIEASMDDKLLLVKMEDHKVVIPFTNAKRITIHDKDIMV